MKENYNALSMGRDTLLKKESKKNSGFFGLFLIMAFSFCFSVNAQVASTYAFSQSNGTFAAPTTGLVGTSGAASTTPASVFGTAWDDGVTTMTLPFTFTYNGASYTQVTISGNGFIVFGSALTPNATGSAYLADGSGTYLSGTSTNNGVAGFNLDQIEKTFATFVGTRTSGSNVISAVASFANLKVGMRLTGTGISSGAIITALNPGTSTITMSANATANSSTAITPRSAIYAAVLGSAPNRQYVITTIAGRRFGSANAADSFDFQFVLSETSNTISVVYGPVTVAATATAAQAGIRSTTADYNSRTTTTNWSATTASTVNTDKLTLSSTIIPASGLTYTWTFVPPACPQPNSVVVSLTSATTASVSWSGATNAVVEWGTPSCVAGTGASAGACGNIVSGTSPQTITGLTLGSSYSIYVRQDCTGAGNGYSTNAAVSFTATPGESCAITQTIPVAANLAASVNTLLSTGLTSDGPNGTCSDGTGNPSKKDRWVSFVAPSSGNKVIITTSAGTGISDAVMQVWSSCPATGVALGCSDDVVGLMPQLEFCTLNPGDTYYVQVWPYSATATGTFNIKIYEDIECPRPPENDECAGVETIIVGAPGSCPASATSGTTTNATATPGVTKTNCDQFGTYNDVFYKFNSGSNTSVDFQFTNVTGTNEFGIYSDCGTTYLGVCSSSSLSAPLTGLTANTDYYIVVWANSAVASGDFTICISTPPAPNCVVSPTSPSNGSTTVNPCAVTLSWPTVSGASSYDVYLDAGAGPATTLVSPAQTGTSYDAGLLAGVTGYSWRVVPKNGTGDAVGCSDFTFTTTGAPACATLTSPANDATICGGLTTFSWTAAGATSYDVYIDSVLVSTQTGTSYSQSMAAGAHTWSVVASNCIGTSIGCVTNNFTSTSSPIGDVYTDAIVLGVITASTSVNGDNENSNCWKNDYTTSSTPGNSLARPGNDVFYQFQITECGSLLDVGTCTSDIDTYIHILDASGARINGDDDSCSTPNTTGSLVTGLTLNPGTYYVVVEGYNDTELGSFTLDFTYTPGIPAQPAPTLACYETATFNTITCAWDVTGTQPTQPTLACYETATFNTTTCAWDVTGTQPTQPTLACYETAMFNTTTCAWDVTGTQPSQPTLACYETATFNTTTCTWDVTGAQPSQPTLACYETATFNTTSCAWDVTGTQPSQPTLACYETATFNTTTCSWDVTGTQPTLGSVTTTVAASYTWPLPFGTGLTYTTGGVYTNTVSCNLATLNLTIAPTVNTFNIGTSCGATVSSLSVTIIAAAVPGATTYTFRITNLNTSASFVVNRPVNSFALSSYGGITLGTPYQIEVSVNGGANYGAPCTVVTPTPVSSIGAQCGTTLTSLTQFVYATFASSVTGYRFSITNTATSNTFVYNALSGQNRFNFSQLPAAFVAYGTTYSVQVALRNTDGSYLPYGTACNITTPAFPTSEIVLSQCDTVATSNTQTFNAVVVSGATAYRFQLTNSTLSYSFSLDRPISNYSLSMFTGLVSGTTYTVRVAVRIGGVWGPLTGKPCNVTTPGIAPGGERLVVESNDFAVITYPNPFAESFMFDVKTTNESTIQVRVYDMLGKQVENRNVEATEINSIQIGSNYPSGVYNVVASQGENTQTLRVIKR